MLRKEGKPKPGIEQISHLTSEVERCQQTCSGKVWGAYIQGDIHDDCDMGMTRLLMGVLFRDLDSCRRPNHSRSILKIPHSTW